MRKIDLMAWDGKPADDSDSISDIGTKKHELSVWEVEDNLKNIDDIALALAMTRDDSKGIMIVLLDPAEISRMTDLNVQVEEQEGRSLYLSQNCMHKNFKICNLSEMGKLASYIHDIVEKRDSRKFIYFDELKLTDILWSKFRNGELDYDGVKAKNSWKKKYKDYEKEKDKISKS